MKTANIASATLRHSESGHLWEEKLTNAQGSLELTEYQTFRVRASGNTTVTIDGVLAATMMANEIMVFNVGRGDNSDTKPTITVAIAGANAWVQVARDVDRPSQ